MFFFTTSLSLRWEGVRPNPTTSPWIRLCGDQNTDMQVVLLQKLRM